MIAGWFGLITDACCDRGKCAVEGGAKGCSMPSPVILSVVFIKYN
jgi:hypothetical protein